MRIGAFEVSEPLPELDKPRLLLSLRPWVDVGSAGTMALAFLEDKWNAAPLGQLARPGDFYDFTRYRPLIAWEGSERRVTVPNTDLRYSPEGGGWITVHAMEPHARGEDFCDSLVELMERLKVREYIMTGSMYGSVPHTRPPIVTGSATHEPMKSMLERSGVRGSRYEGPTSILSTIPERVRPLGIETGTMLVQLPAYAQLEMDYRGMCALLQTLDGLFAMGLELGTVQEQATTQYAGLDSAVPQNPQMSSWVSELESAYDRDYDHDRSSAAPGGSSDLSPELERFLREIERKWESPDSN